MHWVNFPVVDTVDRNLALVFETMETPAGEVRFAWNEDAGIAFFNHRHSTDEHLRVLAGNHPLRRGITKLGTHRSEERDEEVFLVFEVRVGEQLNFDRLLRLPGGKLQRARNRYIVRISLGRAIFTGKGHTDDLVRGRIQTHLKERRGAFGVPSGANLPIRGPITSAPARASHPPIE